MFFVKIIMFALLITLSAPLMSEGPMIFSQNKQQPEFAPNQKKVINKKNPLSDKSFVQLKKGRDDALKNKDILTAIKYLDAMRITCTDPEMVKDILLEMANLYFKIQDWQKAEHAYNEFILLYPGAKQCDYAHYQAIACGFNLTLTPDRDQTKTQETLKLAEQFFTTHPKSDYMPQVTQLATQCREKLLESDMSIFNFYLHGKNFKAAQKRLETIEKEHIPQLPTHQPKVLELSFQLAQAQNNTESVLRTQLELSQKFPEHEITQRLVADLPQVKIQLAQLEQAKTTSIE